MAPTPAVSSHHAVSSSIFPEVLLKQDHLVFCSWLGNFQAISAKCCFYPLLTHKPAKYVRVKTHVNVH